MRSIQKSFYFILLLHAICTASPVFSQVQLKTVHASFSVNNKGFITSITDNKNGKEYCPSGMSSAIMSLYKDKQYLLPQKMQFNKSKMEILLNYPNGSVAKVKLTRQQQYVRLELVSLSPRNGVDNIVWGPYKTNISKTIGEIISVVRSNDFAIGMMALNDNTTSGPPADGDIPFLYFYVHSPDPIKFPLPPNLKEGQTASIGGDGRNDVAFSSQPEEYFRMCNGNGAKLEPSFGSTISLHSRDRRKEQMIRFPVLPDNLDGKANSPRYQLVAPADADFIGSAIALYACPDSLGLPTIENIVLKEGLPHPEIDGKWIKDPASYRTDMAWYGVHDSLASYAKQLGIHNVQDEGWGEYYPNPANRWTKKGVNFQSSPTVGIKEYGAQMQQAGIRYGLHTLCEFMQPGNNSDVAPVPSDSLAIMQRTTITGDITAQDTIITVADTAYFNEFGGWEGNHTNVLKIGKELIEYNGITTTKPYTYLHVKRGLHGTKSASYKAGTTIVKLQPNCYGGFAPDLNLQEVYAAYYGKWLTDGGMDYIDFDGLESCMYQGHGQYSFKRFFRKLFDSYQQNGGKHLRVMGSGLFEGNWHYMSVVNVGGGENMFSPVLNEWRNEGKDVRYIHSSNYFPITFGIQSLSSDWSLYDIENLQAKSIGWDATYMLGLSQQVVETCGEKEDIFKAFRTWETARATNVFTPAIKELLKDMDYKYHLEQTGEKSYLLYQVKENRFNGIIPNTDGVTLSLSNAYKSQPLNFALKVHAPKDAEINGLEIKVGNNTAIRIDRKLMSGEYVICKNGEWYVADHGRKMINRITATGNRELARGSTQVTIKALQSISGKTTLELVVPVIGNEVALREKTQ